MKKHVILEGFLGEKYGREWHIVADTYADIIKCVDANYPGFRKDLIDLANAGGDLAIEVGGNILEEVEDMITTLTNDTIVISPVPAGSKSNTAKVVVGTLLVIASFYIPGLGPVIGPEAAKWLATASLAIGANLAITGLQGMLAPDPSVDEENEYTFNGPENTTVSGNPVPVLCGELIVGGTIISAGSLGGFLTNDATFVIDTPFSGGGLGLPNPGNIDTFTPSYSGPQAEFINTDNIILKNIGE